MMKKVWYLPTTDERNKPLVIKVKIEGENGQWRQLHVIGERYHNEPTIIVHARHITQNWLGAWMKAKRISRFRARCPNLANSGQN